MAMSPADKRYEEWRKVGTKLPDWVPGGFGGKDLSLMWLFNYQRGLKLPPETNLKKLSPGDFGTGLECTPKAAKASFLELIDIGVERMHAEDGMNECETPTFRLRGAYFPIALPAP